AQNETGQERTRSTIWSGQHRILLACFIILSVAATWICLRGREVPENDAARLVATGDLKTNGEHWMIFRFDAPQKKGVQIVSVQVIGNDNISANVYPVVSIGGGSIESIRESKVPISQLLKA